MPIVFLGLLAYPVAEIMLTGWLIAQFGWAWVTLWLFAAFVIGLVMLRHHQLVASLTILNDVRQGRVTIGTLFRLFRYYLAAIFFILPGVLGDVLALLLLLWPVRNTAAPDVADSGVIEGEYRHVKSTRDDKLIP